MVHLFIEQISILMLSAKLVSIFWPISWLTILCYVNWAAYNFMWHDSNHYTLTVPCNGLEWFKINKQYCTCILGFFFLSFCYYLPLRKIFFLIPIQAKVGPYQYRYYPKNLSKTTSNFLNPHRRVRPLFKLKMFNRNVWLKSSKSFALFFILSPL